MNASFEKLIRRNGGYSLPFLVAISDYEETTVLRFVNNNEDVAYENNTYTAAGFSYTPNASEAGFCGGGTLEISVVRNTPENGIIDLIENYRHLKLTVKGILLEDGTVNVLSNYSASYGKVKGDRTKATFTFEKDERLDMTFPALIWTGANNRGNA